ncbi:MAG: sugar phosphate isomerase/epimerase family protein [Christensenellales bacterium]|jgi:sugar phosphate isomerase/epimerase
MKTCFSTLGCPKWSFSDIVSVASDLGYDGIEIRGVLGELYAPAILSFSPSKIEKTISKLKNLSLSIPCLTSSCDLNDENDLEKAKAYVDTASALGAPYIRVLGDKAPSPSDDISLKTILLNLTEIAQYAKNKNVMPLVETNGFFAKSKSLAVLLSEIKNDNVGILYDIHHPYRFFGESPAYTLTKIGPYVKHVHIKDSVINGKKVSYKIVGEGDVPVAEAIRALEDFGYKGYYSLEWVKRWDLSLEEPSIAFAQYMEYMNSI